MDVEIEHDETGFRYVLVTGTKREVSGDAFTSSSDAMIAGLEEKIKRISK